MTQLNRRDFAKLLAGMGAAAAASQLSFGSALAGTEQDFRAIVGIHLVGGNDSWNMIVPTDQRYAGYATSRGPSLALPQEALTPLAGTPFGLHPAMASLQSVWNKGGMAAVLNTGTLYTPLNRALYLARPELRPVNLFSHSDESDHWQGMRPRSMASDGFFGRINDRLPQGKLSPLMSVAGSELILIGQSTSPIMVPTSGSIVRTGANTQSIKTAAGSREAAITAFAQTPTSETLTSRSADMITAAYGVAPTLNNALNNAPGGTDASFVDADGAPLTSDIADQLKAVARMIASRGLLGHSRQVFFAKQGGYDTHAGQMGSSLDNGAHAVLLRDLAEALAAFYAAMVSLGLEQKVTAFTMSDFGRTLKGNNSGGTDHGWGGNHLVVGGAIKPRTIHGAYPNTQLGGPDDSDVVGRFIPTISTEEYVGAIAQWHGVAAADMGYVFPNWANWNGNGRGPVPLFG